MKTWTNEQLIDAVKNSKTIMEVSRKLNLKNLGANSKTIKKYILKLNIDTSHFYSREEQLEIARQNIKSFSNEEMFCENFIDRKHVKKRIIKENLIEYKCQECKICEWNGKELSLHLDHINGINNDNRLENLRFLCPNCHSLTETYCGKKLKKW